MEHLKYKLTALILCKNEEATLAACLSSLSFCDTTIVADDGSSDASVAIASEAGATVITLFPTDSFATKRNKAMEIVQEGWVLFVDADEIVDSILQHEIQKAVQRDDMDGFFITRKDTFLGRKLKYGETGSMWLLRLARVGKGEWKRCVHEQWAVSGKVSRITHGELLHNPHPTLESFFSTINTYTDLEMKERSVEVRTKAFAYHIALFQLFVYTLGKFIYNYGFKLGFLDGIEGFFHAYCMSIHSLLVRIKTLEYIRSL